MVSGTIEVSARDGRLVVVPRATHLVSLVAPERFTRAVLEAYATGLNDYAAAHPGEVCPAKWEQGAETLKPSLDLVGKI